MDGATEVTMGTWYWLFGWPSFAILLYTAVTISLPLNSCAQTLQANNIEVRWLLQQFYSFIVAIPGTISVWQNILVFCIIASIIIRTVTTFSATLCIHIDTLNTTQFFNPTHCTDEVKISSYTKMLSFNLFFFCHWKWMLCGLWPTTVHSTACQWVPGRRVDQKKFTRNCRVPSSSGGLRKRRVGVDVKEPESWPEYEKIKFRIPDRGGAANTNSRLAIDAAAEVNFGRFVQVQHNC